VSKEAFWDNLFSSKDESLYYKEPPNAEVVDIAKSLGQGACVLDLGCGMGRSALFLAEKGFEVTAVDFSREAIERLNSECARRGANVRIIRQDLSHFKFEQNYDLIIAHGSLQFLNRGCWIRLIEGMREHTNKGGYNIIAVFTDKIPTPEDMEEAIGDLFKEGELFELYKDWQIILQQSYIKEDEHPGNIKHRHPINKLLARNGK